MISTPEKSEQGPCCESKGLDTASCCPQPVNAPMPGKREWITGDVNTLAGRVPVISTELTRSDRLDSWKVRWGISRMKMLVEPGIYAVGNPKAESLVFVSANYKISFDRLRSSLKGRDGWILVLDTKGINVWCAAGKGTFGTEELVNRVKAVALDKAVSGRTLILPQLGAPGVQAHMVKVRTGFRIVYGPVRAEDLPVFLDAGMKATPEMRRVRFNLADRLAIAPVEIVGVGRYALIVMAAFLVLSGLGTNIYSLGNVVRGGFPAVAILLAACLAGIFLFPALLPFLPGRSFSLKGLFLGLVSVACLWAIARPDLSRGNDLVESIAWTLIVPSIISVIGLAFTGSTTYTSMSGVKKEVKVALPIQIGAFASGLFLWIISRFL